MPYFYFDIETDGLDPRDDKILTIQCQELGWVTGAPRGDLIIFKEWESSERDILNAFLDFSQLDKPSEIWRFIPVGMNLHFDFSFLMERCERVLGNKIPVRLLFWEKPYIDIKSILVIWNRGRFRGCDLWSLIDSKREGKYIPDWYRRGEYEKIIDYITREARIFIIIIKDSKMKFQKLV